jgi:hypothetical protein
MTLFHKLERTSSLNPKIKRVSPLYLIINGADKHEFVIHFRLSYIINFYRWIIKPYPELDM